MTWAVWEEVFKWLLAPALVAAVIATWNAKRAERWKRKEYVLKAFQDRYDSPGAKNASFLLYWADRHIRLWADDETPAWERVTDEEAAKAILPYVIHPFNFGALQWKDAKRRIALNDSFVDLIWRLDQVRVVSRAAHPEDIREVIHEVAEILTDHERARRLAPPGRLVPPAFRLMIAFRGMHDLTRFFDESGYDIRYTEDDHRKLMAAFPDLPWHQLAYEDFSKTLTPRARQKFTWGQFLTGKT